MKIYTTGVAARLLGLGTSTIQRALTAGKLKFFMTPGGHFRILEKDLEEFATQQGLAWPPPDLGAPRRMTKVLIVDDEPSYVQLMSAVFQNHPDYEIRTTSSGYEAGILTQRFLPDAILLDVLLKDIDGREVCRLIKRNPELEHIRIIAVTALESESDIKEIMAAGADDYIAKPFDTDILFNKVELCLRSRSSVLRR